MASGKGGMLSGEINRLHTSGPSLAQSGALSVCEG
jgi:hypothetical protein